MPAAAAANSEDPDPLARALLAAAVSERQRIQRDLHDGAQQRLVAMNAKLALARKAVSDDARRADGMLAGVQAEMAIALQELRSLASGVFPPVLAAHGLASALRAACRRCSMPASVSAATPSRYAQELEGAVYFTCAEALQNADKHAGNRAHVSVRVWEDGALLRFAVRDSGAGFTAARERERGNGLQNMRDRIAAVGGTLIITSWPGGGTMVEGAVPLVGASHERTQIEHRPR
jgi:signal transduction histidine kinase